MVVVLATVLIRGTGSQAGNDVAWKSCKAELARNESCYDNGAWKPKGSVHENWAKACKSYDDNYEITDESGSCVTGYEKTKYIKTEVCLGCTYNYYCCGVDTVGGT